MAEAHGLALVNSKSVCLGYMGDFFHCVGGLFEGKSTYVWKRAKPATQRVLTICLISFSVPRELAIETNEQIIDSNAAHFIFIIIAAIPNVKPNRIKASGGKSSGVNNSGEYFDTSAGRLGSPAYLSCGAIFRNRFNKF